MRLATARPRDGSRHGWYSGTGALAHHPGAADPVQALVRAADTTAHVPTTAWKTFPPDHPIWVIQRGPSTSSRGRTVAEPADDTTRPGPQGGWNARRWDARGWRCRAVAPRPAAPPAAFSRRRPASR